MEAPRTSHPRRVTCHPVRGRAICVVPTEPFLMTQVALGVLGLALLPGHRKWLVGAAEPGAQPPSGGSVLQGPCCPLALQDQTMLYSLTSCHRCVRREGVTRQSPSPLVCGPVPTELPLLSLLSPPCPASGPVNNPSHPAHHGVALPACGPVGMVAELAQLTTLWPGQMWLLASESQAAGPLCTAVTPLSPQ